MKRRHLSRRAFTLVELLVVVSIVGLLAVAVLPALSSGGDRRLLRGAAERVDTHLKRAAAVATGKARGEAVWLEADVGTAVLLDLNFARVPTGTPGTATVTPTGSTATVNPSLPVTAGSVAFPMVPTEFRIATASQITLAGTQSIYNTAFPSGSNDYTAYPPPSGPRITSRPTVLPEQSCIDLSASTIGVYGFGDYAEGGTPTPLSTYATIAICFDSQGRPMEVWGNPDPTVVTSLSTNVRHVLSPGNPLALLVTSAGDASVGSGVANADARWVVIDPKTGRNIIVPNVSGAITVNAAQAFIVDDLGG